MLSRNSKQVEWHACYIYGYYKELVIIEAQAWTPWYELEALEFHNDEYVFHLVKLHIAAPPHKRYRIHCFKQQDFPFYVNTLKTSINALLSLFAHHQLNSSSGYAQTVSKLNGVFSNPWQTTSAPHFPNSFAVKRSCRPLAGIGPREGALCVRPAIKDRCPI